MTTIKPAHTATKTGLRVEAALEEDTYPTGSKVTAQELATLQVPCADCHGEWNYTITPHNREAS